ncbi:MAG: high-potential iron-sulfur protein [Halobacteriota archaeon]
MGGTSIGATAGCLGFGGSPEEEEEPGRADDWCVEENDTDVPEAFLTAESINGIVRDPDELSSREEAAYQCHPQGYQLCANCRYFIPAKPGETDDKRDVGACAIVEGRVRSQDWCALYQETEQLAEFPNPDPLGESGQQKPPERN